MKADRPNEMAVLPSSLSMVFEQRQVGARSAAAMATTAAQMYAQWIRAPRRRDATTATNSKKLGAATAGTRSGQIVRISGSREA